MFLGFKQEGTNMVLTLFLSIVIKAFSAVIEIAIQMLLTHSIGVAGYGEYTFLVNIVEISYWLCFSGMVKCNTFYLSDREASISEYKKRFFTWLILPVIVIAAIACVILHKPVFVLAVFILVLYYFAFDVSSTFMARGAATTFLLGEYLVGRVFLGIVLAASLKLGITQIAWLFALYGIQYVAVLVWFFINRKKIQGCGSKQIPVDTGKLFQYQQSDIATGLISQSPVILQYLFVGAYETGFAGIVVTVKKLVNFISGPTAKIFLPEFSRLYKQGKKEEIWQFYNIIVRIQMVFVATIGVALLGFSELVLKLFSPELMPQLTLFRLVAAAFLVVAGIGPATGLLQMTGQEKKDNIMRWISIGLMILIWIVMRDNGYFALYGLVAQALTEGSIKYFLVRRWFGKAPISLGGYLLLWLPAVVLIAVAVLLKLGNSLFAAIAFCVLCALLTLGILLMDEKIRTTQIESVKRGVRK